MVPAPAMAQNPDLIAYFTGTTALDKVLEVLKNAALIGVKNAMSAFLGKLAYDAAVYVASAGTGQESLVYDQPIGEYLSDAGDAALGGVIEGVATAAGLDAAGLCDPGDDFRINLTIGLETNIGAPAVYKPACTLSELAGNWREAYSDPNFSDFVGLQFDSTANPLGIALEVNDLALVAKDEARTAAEQERAANSDGFKDKVEQVSGTILTPGSEIKKQFDEPQNFAQQFAVQSIGNPAVDALSIFTSTLISKLMARAQQGLANLTSGSSLSGLLGGSFSGTVSGRAAAEARYASLRQPTFSASGSFDVLSELVACPDDEALRTVNNCSIGTALQTAIEDGWTVQEFIDYQADAGQSFILANSSVNPITTSQIENSEGVSETGIAVMKKYRIVPVGWQIASDYIAESSDTPNLEQLANCYNYCGTADEERTCDFLLTDSSGAETDYSPYCGLVDPYWVLKAPQNFCEREAPGDTILSADSFDTDANESTQEQVTLSRLNYCADVRGCIEEEQEGVCTAYGYCTEEERIYRFDGDICDEEYSSCQTFKDSDGNDVSYVKSSLNYNDCATDPGCQWYCLSTDDQGEFNCASPTETFIGCSEELTNDEASYGLDYDVSYDENEACACTTTQTCTVLPGSTTGDSIINTTGLPGTDGLLDYTQCNVTNTDGSQSTCTLSDNCGASNSTYNSTTETCTCTITNEGYAEAGDTSVDIAVDVASGGHCSDSTYTTEEDCVDAGESWIGTQTCTLDDEDASGSADTCTSDYSGYSNAPVCTATDPEDMNCGEVCYTETGGTCTNNLGNSCTDGSDTDSDSTDGECVLSDSCDITTGATSCTSASGNTCILGTVAEEPLEQSDTIYFDSNVETCESDDASCTQYIRIQPDTNLINNAYFDYIDASDTVSDTTRDSLAFCTHDGGGCTTDNACDEDDDGTPEGECVGWIQNGSTAYDMDSSFDSSVAPNVGTHYVRLDVSSTGGTFDNTVDTGHALENRTFTFAYSASTTAATCSDVSFTIGASDGSAISNPVTASADGTDYEYTADWQDFTTTYTFPDGISDTSVTVSIAASATCEVSIEAASLTEADEFDDYSDYAENNTVYLNGDTLSCEPEDVGCELYVENGKDDEEGIPGLITNADSAACVGTCSDSTYDNETDCTSAGETWDATAYNYGNPSCSQCNGNVEEDQPDDYYAGCDFYQEVELNHTAPIVTDESWLASNADARNGAMQRSGMYCSGNSDLHCFNNSDCPSGSACIEEVSIVPDSGDQCSASAVGCEEYTNLATVEAGGEGLEYYTQLQQCVRRDDLETAVFYTFEGSDSSGVAVEDHTLKVDPDNSNAPCTNLDLSSEDYNADCIDSDYTSSEQLAWDCGPDGDLNGDGVNNDLDDATDDSEYGTDPDCRQYATDDGTIYYRYESDVIVASDDCTPLRNSQDTRVYFALPGESTSCSAGSVSCREYKGTDSGSEETIIDEDFISNETTYWLGATSTSNESILQSGYSLQLHDSDTSDTSNDTISYALFEEVDTDSDGTNEINGLLNDDVSYVLTFWAKATESGSLSVSIGLDGTTSNDYYFSTDGSSTTATTVAITGDSNWHQYKLGPVIIPLDTNVDDGDEYFNLNFTGTTGNTEAYIDTILLTESNSQYLIQDTATTCNNFEGCREYEDRDGNTLYLKSFLRLCGDDVVGCEAMIATQNSSNPFTTAFNLDNEYDQDDVIVHADEAVTLVYDTENECSSQVMGCTAVGIPDVDERTGEIIDYETTYLLDQPDSYESTLCEQPQLSCEEYDAGYDGTTYFKDPGEKLCELKEYTSDSNTFKGWFKVDSTATEPDCPIQNDYTGDFSNYASQPLGGVCNSNSIKVSSGACADSSGNAQVFISQSECEDNGFIWDDAYVDNRVGGLCNSDTDCYPDGWSSSDPRPRCISSLDDDVDVNDGGVHQYVTTQDDDVTLSDYYTDFGWTGVCPADQSGCSEYVDPYSPNITENNDNWSFEDDVRSDSNAYYTADEVATGFPDWWKIPYNQNSTGVDNDGDGDVDTADDNEIDLDLDGTADFTSTNCDATNALITSFTGDTITPVDGSSVLKLTGPCAVSQYATYNEIEPDKTYTIQAQVKMPKDQMDTGDGTGTPSEFSVGILFYTADSTTDDDSLPDQIETDTATLYPVADHETLGYEDGTDTDGLSYWYRFEGAIGLGTTIPIPSVDSYCDGFSGFGYRTRGGCALGGGTWVTGDYAQFARVFVVNNSTGTIYFDAVSFKEADKYYYIDYTVDGTPEREQQDGTNTCLNQDTDESQITSDGGCVAFRDMTNDSQSYSQDGLDCTACLLNPNSDACRYIADACDTNSVLKVKKDRICSEWLSCESAQLVEDDNGNTSSQCFSINRCRELDENGNCADFIVDPSNDELSASSDLHYTSANGDANQLSAIRNLTGYSKVGLTWNDVLFCSGGPYDGSRCSSDSQCQTDTDTTGTCSVPFTTQGYYPYGWMTEVGDSGASSGEDLIELNDFENLFCAGTLADSTLPCTENATLGGYGNCYSNDLKTKVDAGDMSIDQALFFGENGDGFLDDNGNPINTDAAFCPNSPNFGVYWPYGGDSAQLKYSLNGWQPMPVDGNSNIFITQYQDFESCEAPCNTINLNNVLEIGPESDAGDDNAFAGGTSYDLADNIAEGGSYSLSFDARYVDTEYTAVDEGGVPSTVRICLQHYNIGKDNDNSVDSDGDGDATNDLEQQDRKDCFVNGFGMADIVFAIDTSGSMGEEIDEVAQAVPALASQLSSAGIDARFALIDVDDNDASGADADFEGNHIDLDFTSDINEFTTAVNAMSAENANVDPLSSIFETAENSFFDNTSLTYRADANRFLIVVTDTGDELEDNEIGYSEAQDAAVAAELPVFVLSSGYYDCANGGNSTTSTCRDYYDTLAEATGGDAYAYDDTSTGVTYDDWAANTDIINDIFSNILDIIDVFQFDNTMQHYSMGPITVVENDIDETDGEEQISNDDRAGLYTQLEFLGSDGAAFQIDNVSLLPVLEVSKELDTIGRTCRAYPEADSMQCTYDEINGTHFEGWKGYCVETDPLNAKRCITWWPIDVLTGETSIVSREPAGYSGPSDLYYCMVSKGLEHPGFCDEDDYTDNSDDYINGYGQGVICTSDATCTNSRLTGTCFQGANYVLPDSTSGGIIEHDDVTANYSEHLTVDGGECTVIADNDRDCSEWSGTGSCYDSGGTLLTSYQSEEDCIDADSSNVWSEVTDLLNNTEVLSTGDCVDIATGGLDDGYVDDYASYDDPQDGSLTADLYCFYDVDGTGGNEVRSTRSCNTDSDCQRATSTAFYCADLACSAGDNNQACSYGGDECDTYPAAQTDTPYETRPLRWQMPDPFETIYGEAFYDSLGGGAVTAACVASGAFTFSPPCLIALTVDLVDATNDAENAAYENGVIVRLPANELLRNINASEMAVIEFNPGSAGDGGGAGNEYPVWGQLNGSDDSLGSKYDKSNGDDINDLDERGNVWLTDLFNGAIEFDDSGNIVDHHNCYSYHDGDDKVGFGCRVWGLYDSKFLLDSYSSNNPSLPNFVESDDGHGLDLVYTWVWSNFDWGTQIDEGECNISGGSDDSDINFFEKIDDKDINDWSENGCIDDAIKYIAGTAGSDTHERNVWKDIEGSALWGQFYSDDPAGTKPEIFTFDQSDVTDSHIWPDDDNTTDNPLGYRHDGGNILSLYIDFNDEGFIQAVYVMEYVAARGTPDTPFLGTYAMVETTLDNMMSLDIQTRESCVLAGQAVSATGDQWAWASRSTQQGYNINDGTTDAYGEDTSFEPFGAIDPQTESPAQWDTVSHPESGEDGWPNWSTYEAQPVIASISDDNIDAGHPLTCIGDCSETACVGDPGSFGQTGCSNSSCGDAGVCMGIGDGTISSEGEDSGIVSRPASLQDQIDGVSIQAADRLKHVFANIESFYQLTFGTATSIYDPADNSAGYWDTTSTSGVNLYDNMSACNGDGSARPDALGDDEEYCGVYPTVSSITVDDLSGSDGEYYDINNGQTVTLKFTTNVDNEQQPLKDIYIDWGDGTEPRTINWDAAPTTHIFTHAYGCTPDNGARYQTDADGQVCYFKPKITIQDNWDWCSGTIVGRCSDSSYDTEEACLDANSTNTWDDTITDHHRFDRESSQNLTSSCASYDESSITIAVHE